MITIYEIAKLASCSPSTVSKALNNSSEISDKKKKEITLIAKKNKYIPNQSARSLITKSNKLLGIIYRDDLGIGLEHYFYARVIEGFRKYTENNGYDIIFINSNDKMSYVEHCIYRGVKGVFIPIYDGHVKKEIHDIIESSIHVVFADDCKEKVTRILSDDQQGANIAVSYLQSLGHKQIIHLAGPFKGETESLSSRARLEGYKKSVKNPVVFMAKDFSFEAGYKTMKEIILTKELPTAIFAGSDILALGALKAMQEAKIRVPKDISIIGYDDISIIPFFSPLLTTIRQEKYRIGELAARSLIDYLDENVTKETVTPSLMTLPVRLIERETCRDLNA